MDSAGVERGSKMFGTGLSLRGLAVHNPATKRIPAIRTSIPLARPTTTPQSVLCVVLCIFLGPAVPCEAALSRKSFRTPTAMFHDELRTPLSSHVCPDPLQENTDSQTALETRGERPPTRATPHSSATRLLQVGAPRAPIHSFLSATIYLVSLEPFPAVTSARQ